MPRILEEIQIHCPNCGFYLWRHKSSIYNLTTDIEEVTDRDVTCRICSTKTYIAMLKGADRIVPLNINERGDGEKPQ